MKPLLTRAEFLTRRRRADRSHLTIAVVTSLPLLVLLVLPDLFGWKSFVDSLPGKLGTIPYVAALLWIFGGIAYANRSWKRGGLVCPSCGKDFRQDAELEVVTATGRCGSKVLSDDA
jgi:hypothetical protein